MTALDDGEPYFAKERKEETKLELINPVILDLDFDIEDA